MSWLGIEGHDAIVERFRRSLAAGRLASTFLFTGTPGIGKRAFAEKLAQTLLCQTVAEEQMAPCGQCAGCVQVASHSHPDLYLIEKPADKSTLPLSLFIGDEAHRMREGLCHDIGLKPFMGGRKVAIIDDADALNEESANALLKTLEEPPPRSVLILIGTSPDRQLPTIRSRCQSIRFQPLEPAALTKILVDQGLVADAAEAARIAPLAEGSLQRAVELADEELRTFRRRWLNELSRRQLGSAALARDLVAFVEAAGKEAPARRARARQVVGFTVEFFRQVLRGVSGAALGSDDDLAIAVRQALKESQLDGMAALACLERTLDAAAHLDRNAHQATLLECWLDDLARIYENGAPVEAYGAALG